MMTSQAEILDIIRANPGIEQKYIMHHCDPKRIRALLNKNQISRQFIRKGKGGHYELYIMEGL